MREVKCPLCGKAIGKLVVDDYHDTGTMIGAIELVHEELDYRKASRLYWQERRATGTLCRKCAKQKVPSGKYYLIAYYGNFGKDYLYGGDNDQKYFDREKAEKKAEEFAERYGRRYWVEERKI